MTLRILSLRILSGLLFVFLTAVELSPAAAASAGACALAVAPGSKGRFAELVRKTLPPGARFAVAWSTHSPHVDLSLDDVASGGVRAARRLDAYQLPETEIVLIRRSNISSEREIYESHIAIADNARGLNLGAALYVLMAQTTYDHGGILYSTTSPSPAAVKTWDRLVGLGWAEKISFMDREDVFRYRIKPDLLDANFFAFPAEFLR